jgi:acetyltransferase-like isoleucine patch superfamily enzyme
VGAGAVVVGDIPAHVVAVGVPARVVRSFGIESTPPAFGGEDSRSR